MSFLDDEQDGPKPGDNYLKLVETEQGKPPSKVKIRVLDEKARGVWRHWIGPDRNNARPFNCPSRGGGCAACAERDFLKSKGADHRDLHKMEKKYLVNALVLGEAPEVKIFSFGKRLSEKMNFLLEEYGDLRDYDITVIRRKTGPEKFNVEYDAIYSDDPDPKKRRKLTAAEAQVAETRFPIDDEVKAADREVIAAAVQAAKGGVSSNGHSGGALATPEQIEKLTEVAKSHGFKLGDLQVTNPERETADHINELIAKLS